MADAPPTCDYVLFMPIDMETWRESGTGKDNDEDGTSLMLMLHWESAVYGFQKRSTFADEDDSPHCPIDHESQFRDELWLQMAAFRGGP